MFCLDTNIIIDIFRGNTALKNKMLQFKDTPAKFYITSITLCELFKGAYKSKNREKAIELITKFYKSVKVLTFDLASTNLFGLNHNLMEKKGKKVPEADLMIASLAMANNCILITKDLKHFNHIPNIKLEKW